MTVTEPMALLIEPLVRGALAEDLGRAGDLTTDTIVPVDARASGVLNARKAGVVAGLKVAETAFRLLDPDVRFEVSRSDGADVAPSQPIATVTGRARALLTAERVALNFLCHLSGIATATREIVDAVKGTRARIACTRKTTPGLRLLEKYAVRVGGGVNHRFGLDDGVLLKDNHIVVAGGIRAAIETAKARLGHMVKVEVEVDRLDQIDEALAAHADAILLDNMTPAQMREAVAVIDRRAIVEASGRITKETAPAIAAAGVDVISCGWITHSAAILDIGLDFDDALTTR
ncbi:MAG TPA: carboxylating nicotinate-nucleotide diphosphorylase [Stellaceae bacterium]|nr:carboxylating nicotinate-nucleotide diphosphorylase [Stellaceae bacterium]